MRNLLFEKRYGNLELLGFGVCLALVFGVSLKFLYALMPLWVLATLFRLGKKVADDLSRGIDPPEDLFDE